MENPEKNNPPSFFLIIIALIIGSALFKQVDFKTFKVEHPALAAVYLITLVGCVYFLIKGRKGRVEK